LRMAHYLKVIGMSHRFYKASVSIQMDRFILVNGQMENLKAMASRSGPMVVNMMDAGTKASQLVKESRHTLMDHRRVVVGRMVLLSSLVMLRIKIARITQKLESR